MIDPARVPPVTDDELLARFATQSGQVRADLTVKPDLFMPHPRRELSVVRHRDATVEELWIIGCRIAHNLERRLYGRADILAVACQVDGLRVVASPAPNNPNHADVVGWPESKADMKALTQKLAAAAAKLVRPPEIASPNPSTPAVDQTGEGTAKE